MEYQCTLISGKRKERWQGEIRLIHYSDTCYEAEITGRGTYFHVIAGKHRYGNYNLYSISRGVILSPVVISSFKGTAIGG